MTIIADYLAHHNPKQVKMLVIQNNEEASSYRSDIQTALMQGGWEITAIDYRPDVRQGSRRFFNRRSETSRLRPDPRNPNAQELFNDAMQRARVQHYLDRTRKRGDWGRYIHHSNR